MWDAAQLWTASYGWASVSSIVFGRHERCCRLMQKAVRCQAVFVRWHMAGLCSLQSSLDAWKEQRDVTAESVVNMRHYNHSLNPWLCELSAEPSCRQRACPRYAGCWLSPLITAHYSPPGYLFSPSDITACLCWEYLISVLMNRNL